MRSFIVGLFVIVMFSLLSLIGFLLVPFFLILGLLFRLILGLCVALFVIWFIGKVTLLLIDYLAKRADKPL